MKICPGSTVRPTADRVREALFNILAPQVRGSRFLDLYAGTGAVGLEALSRGAAQAVFVERNRRVVALLRDNLASMGMSALATVRAGEAGLVIAALGREGWKFDLVFMDPPYAEELADKTIQKLSRARVLDRGGWIIVESSHRNPPAECISGFKVWRREHYGQTLLSFYRQEDELS